MGKIRSAKNRRQQRQAKNNPTTSTKTTTSTGEEECNVLSISEEQKSFLEKINSPDETERLWCIGSIARLVVEQPTTFQFVLENSDVVGDLVKRISDPLTPIRTAACGVIRNLCVMGDVSVCDKIIKKDCLNSLFVVINTYQSQKNEKNAKTTTTTTTTTPEQENEQFEIDELLFNVLSILVNLSEYSTVAIQEILSKGILPLLFHFIRPSIATINIALASAELLSLITEDYPPSVNHITPDNIMLLKVTLANQKNNIMLRTFTIEILLNISQQKEHFGVLKIAVPTLSACLDYDATRLFFKLSSPEFENVMKQLTDGIMPNDLQNELHIWEMDVKAQVNALQILSNVFIQDDGEEDDKMEVSTSPTTQPIEIFQLYNQLGVFQKLLPKCSFMDTVVLNFYSLKMIKNYLNQFWNIQSRALSCLNNIVLSFPVDALGDINGLFLVVFGLCQRAFETYPTNANNTTTTTTTTATATATTTTTATTANANANANATATATDTTAQREVQNLLTTILYSLLKKATPQIQLSPIHVSAIFSLLTHSDYEIRMNTIGMLGCIAKTPLANSVIQDIGVALVSGLSDPSGWVSSEAVNAIFEIFDDHFDEVVTALSIIEKLQLFERSTKQKLKEDKNMDKLLCDRLDEAVINIGPFIDYKKKQKRK